MLLALLVSDVGCRRTPDTDHVAPRAVEPGLHQVDSTSSSALGGEDRLLASLRTVFQEKNPKLAQVGVLDLKAWDFVGPRLVLGWAIVRDHTFRGDFNDEMFGVFVVNDSLTRVERVVDTFPTGRWFDEEVRFGKFTGDSVEVLRKGATYGDGPSRRVYKWQ